MHIRIILILVVLLFYPSNSNSAEFSRLTEFTDDVIISGKFESGDYKKFKRYIVNHYSSFPYIFTIKSPGGNLTEAMMIGRDIREAFGTVSTSSCSSACVFVLIAGTKRLVMEGPAVIRLHRPYFDAEYFSTLGTNQAATEYKKLLAYSREYLIEMGMPTDIVDEMYTKGSDEVLEMDGKIFSQRIGTTEAAHYEIVAASCRKLDQRQRQDYEIFSGLETTESMARHLSQGNALAQEIAQEYRAEANQIRSRYSQEYRDYINQLRDQEGRCEFSKFQETRNNIYARYKKELAIEVQ